MVWSKQWGKRFFFLCLSGWACGGVSAEDNPGTFGVGGSGGAMDAVGGKSVGGAGSSGSVEEGGTTNAGQGGADDSVGSQGGGGVGAVAGDGGSAGTGGDGPLAGGGGLTGMGGDGGEAGAGVGAGGQSGGAHGVAGSGGAAGAGGDNASDGGSAGSGGAEGDVSEDCAAPADASQFDGATLYVDDEPGCAGNLPCYSSISGAVYAAKHGDTIEVLPGTYLGASIYQDADVGALRIRSQAGPEVTKIQGTCFRVQGDGRERGQIWIEGFSFGSCGGASSVISTGWGVFVSTWNDVDVRIEGNVFAAASGRGAIGLDSGTVGVRFHAVVARNRIADQTGQQAAIDIDLPADWDEDYCVRVENNLVTGSAAGLRVHYATFDDGPGRFEFVNNTVTGNDVGLYLSVPAGKYLFANNIFYGNTTEMYAAAERLPFDVRNSIIGSSQFSGLKGNLAIDPLLDADFRPRLGSPAIDAGDATVAPGDDLAAAPRGDVPDIGAYELAEDAAEPVAELACGDGQISWGEVSSEQGTFTGFEACEDGNTLSGDGCSSLCQLEPRAAHNRMSVQASSLCVVRADKTLSCWGDAATNAPAGEFEQVAVSFYHSCALLDDGSVQCWHDSGGTSFAPEGEFVQISGDYSDTCGVRSDGEVHCWDSAGLTLSKAGEFVDVHVNHQVCALSSSGDVTCWHPLESEPSYLSGPFVRVIAAYDGGCGIKASGELTCMPGTEYVEEAPAAGLVSADSDGDYAVGLRPDGRVVQWGFSGMSMPVQDRSFIEVAAGGYGVACGLTASHSVYCWNNNYGLPQE